MVLVSLFFFFFMLLFFFLYDYPLHTVRTRYSTALVPMQYHVRASGEIRDASICVKLESSAEPMPGKRSHFASPSRNRYGFLVP